MQTHNRFIVIMAGGIGSRFWPVSTEERPKQFLDILGVGRTLLQLTWDRARKLVPASHILIVTHRQYAEQVRNQLPDAFNDNILLEPAMRNTAPCVAYAALRLHTVDPDSVFAVLPSDHVILKEEAYIQILEEAFEFAAQHDALVTLGIQPTRPDTGYGYIQFSPVTEQDHLPGMQRICKVRAFKEKPDSATAGAYLESGEYLWNAGMFVWSTRNILDAFHKHCPAVLETLTKDPNPYNTTAEQSWIDAVYPETQKISIDYAVMEKATNVFTIPADIGWSDLGTWQSLHAYLGGESDAVTVGSNIHLSSCHDVLVFSDNPKTVVIKGLSDYIVVDDSHALLIYPKSDEQEIRDIVAKLSAGTNH